MIVRGIDSENDWLFGKGKNDYNANVKAVQQNLKTRCQSFLGDCFFEQSAGIDWFNLLGSKNQLALELAVRATILNTAYVTGIVNANVVLDPITRTINMSYKVNTSFADAFSPSGVVSDSVSLLLTEDGLVLTNEDGIGLALG